MRAIEDHTDNTHPHIVLAGDRLAIQRTNLVSAFDQHGTLHAHEHRSTLSLGQQVDRPLTREEQVRVQYKVSSLASLHCMRGANSAVRGPLLDVSN